jgi:glycosyltransferase involved in cell wall biosynthesis
MIKLMIVIHSLRGGGSERVLINLLKGLDRSVFSITLILYERVFDFPLPEDIEVKILDIHASRNILKLTTGFILKTINLARLIRQNKPDVLFSLISSTNVTLILAKLLSRIKCKLIVSEHTHPSINLKNEIYGGITKGFIKCLYPKADRIIAVSEGIKRDLIQNFHISEDKVTVIHNPVDISEIEKLSQEMADHPWFHGEVPIIVSVGRLTRQKGYPYLLQAFSIVKSSQPCRLLLIGEGEDRTKLIEMAKELGIEADVEFLGFQENPFKYMVCSSLFVLSSLFEGFGNVIVEAMTLGLPVISTDCPSGPSEIIEDKKNGILVPVKDEKALAQTILQVLSDNRLSKELGENAVKRASDFSIDRIVKKYMEVFFENSSSPL